jgi:hypothetical protein
MDGKGPCWLPSLDKGGKGREGEERNGQRQGRGGRSPCSFF